jgi:hypothetical protein
MEARDLEHRTQPGSDFRRQVCDPGWARLRGDGQTLSGL